MDKYGFKLNSGDFLVTIGSLCLVMDILRKERKTKSHNQFIQIFSIWISRRTVVSLEFAIGVFKRRRYLVNSYNIKIIKIQVQMRSIIGERRAFRDRDNPIFRVP